MAEKLVCYFEEAEKKGGIKAKMRLTVLSGITAIAAKTLPDSSENVTKIEKGMQEIRKEFN